MRVIAYFCYLHTFLFKADPRFATIFHYLDILDFVRIRQFVFIKNPFQSLHHALDYLLSPISHHLHTCLCCVTILDTLLRDQRDFKVRQVEGKPFSSRIRKAKLIKILFYFELIPSGLKLGLQFSKFRNCHLACNLFKIN